MKKILALMLAVVLCLSLAACGGKDFSALTEQQKQAAQVVDEILSSSTFKQAQKRFKSLKDTAPREPAVTDVTIYEAESLDGFPVEFMLINVEADFVTGEKGNGFIQNNLQIVIDLKNGVCVDSLHTDIYAWMETSYFGVCMNAEDARLLGLWAYGGYMDMGGTYIWEEQEVRTPMSEADLDAINAALA